MERHFELTSNGFALAHDDSQIARLQPTPAAAPIATLREQYEAQGYLWLKGLLDRNAAARAGNRPG
jgi:hypothetical protein